MAVKMWASKGERIACRRMKRADCSRCPPFVQTVLYSSGNIQNEAAPDSEGRRLISLFFWASGCLNL